MKAASKGTYISAKYMQAYEEKRKRHIAKKAAKSESMYAKADEKND